MGRYGLVPVTLATVLLAVVPAGQAQDARKQGAEVDRIVRTVTGPILKDAEAVARETTAIDPVQRGYGEVSGSDRPAQLPPEEVVQELRSLDKEHEKSVQAAKEQLRVDLKTAEGHLREAARPEEDNLLTFEEARSQFPLDAEAAFARFQTNLVALNARFDADRSLALARANGR